MKKLIYLIFCTLATSCILELPELSKNPVAMSKLTVSDDFSWSTTKEITVNIHNATQSMVFITSEDNSQMFYKGFNDGSSREVSVKINVPLYLKNLKVNDQLLDIDNSSVQSLYMDIYLINNLKSQHAAAVNYSLHLNGITDWIAIPNTEKLVFPNAFSLEAWVKAERQQTAKIVQKGDWDGFSLGQDLYKGWMTSVCNDSMASTNLTWGKGRPVLNRWYHIAATYNGKDYRLYVDGVLVNSTVLHRFMNNNGRIISIGSDKGGQKFFKGYMDNVTIWTTEMTAEEVLNSIHNGISGSEKGLLACWKMDEGSGDKVYNSVSALYPGNLIGSFSSDLSYGSDNDGDGVLNNYDEFPDDATRAFGNIYPSGGYGSLAFEDMWPANGDFDFNDLVIDYQFKNISNSKNKLVESYATFIIKAAGATKRNGFGFQLSGQIPAFDMTVSGSEISDHYISLGADGWERNENKPTCIVFDNSQKCLKSPDTGIGANTSENATYVTPDTIVLHITYTPDKYTLADLDISAFNPFMIIGQNRGKEVHLIDYPPTSLVDTIYFGKNDDASDLSSGKYYRSKNNLPWAINLYEIFDYPFEKTDILKAYTKMASWATSKGTLFPDWYQNKVGYRNNLYIYK